MVSIIVQRPNIFLVLWVGRRTYNRSDFVFEESVIVMSVTGLDAMFESAVVFSCIRTNNFPTVPLKAKVEVDVHFSKLFCCCRFNLAAQTPHSDWSAHHGLTKAAAYHSKLPLSRFLDNLSIDLQLHRPESIHPRSPAYITRRGSNQPCRYLSVQTAWQGLE